MPDRGDRSAKVVADVIPDDDEQRDMQRRRLVERLVKAAEHGKQHSGQAIGLRPDEGHGQWEQDEAGNRDDLSGQVAAGEAVDSAGGRVDGKRQAVEQVDRPVGDDGPGEERHMSFPGKDDAADVRALRGERVCIAVGEVEERREDD